MRKLLLVALALLVCAATAPAQESAEKDYTAVFGGMEYSSKDKSFMGTTGTALNVVGGLWVMARAKFGTNASIEPDLAYVFRGGGLVWGIVAGPTVEWIVDDNERKDDPVTYLAGASGALVGYTWNNNKVGLYLGGKYHFAYKADTWYPDGWRAGLWLAFKP